jgi:hypothetical protein
MHAPLPQQHTLQDEGIFLQVNKVLNNRWVFVMKLLWPSDRRYCYPLLRRWLSYYGLLCNAYTELFGLLYNMYGVIILMFRIFALLDKTWGVGMPYFTALAQITLSSVMLCLSLSDVDCFYALWNETVLPSFKAFDVSKKCILLKINI